MGALIATIFTVIVVAISSVVVTNPNINFDNRSKASSCTPCGEDERGSGTDPVTKCTICVKNTSSSNYVPSSGNGSSAATNTSSCDNTADTATVCQGKNVGDVVNCNHTDGTALTCVRTSTSNTSCAAVTGASCAIFASPSPTSAVSPTLSVSPTSVVSTTPTPTKACNARFISTASTCGTGACWPHQIEQTWETVRCETIKLCVNSSTCANTTTCNSGQSTCIENTSVSCLNGKFVGAKQECKNGCNASTGRCINPVPTVTPKPSGTTNTQTTNASATPTSAPSCVGEGGVVSSGTANCCSPLVKTDCVSQGSFSFCICKSKVDPTPTPTTKNCTVRNCSDSICKISTQSVSFSQACPSSNCVNDSDCKKPSTNVNAQIGDSEKPATLFDIGHTCQSDSECQKGNCYAGNQVLGGSPFDSAKTCHANPIVVMDETQKDLATNTAIGEAAILTAVVAAPVAAEVVSIAAANGGISALPLAATSYATAALSTLPAWTGTAVTVASTLPGAYFAGKCLYGSCTQEEQMAAFMTGVGIQEIQSQQMIESAASYKSSFTSSNGYTVPSSGEIEIGLLSPHEPGYNLNTVPRLKEIMDKGGVLDPIEITVFDGKIFTVDGANRVTATLQSGSNTISFINTPFRELSQTKRSMIELINDGNDAFLGRTIPSDYTNFPAAYEFWNDTIR